MGSTSRGRGPAVTGLAREAAAVRERPACVLLVTIESRDPDTGEGRRDVGELTPRPGQATGGECSWIG